MVRHLDANDIFVMSRGGASGHFSDGTSVLLALAERHRRSGKELLTCLVASYELQGALAESVDFWRRGLHPVTNVAWVLPIVAARLMGATPAVAAHACGMAAASATVINTWIKPGRAIPLIKSVAAGLASKHALEAAELAALGATASTDALETILALGDFPPRMRFDSAPVENLGRSWSMPRNMLKLYPAQINTQAAIEAALRLHQRGVRAEHLRKLALHGHQNVAGGVQGSVQAFAPRDRESADHSTPYVMAMALLRSRLTPQEYEGAPWDSAEVKSVMAKIELVVDPHWDSVFAAGGTPGVRLVAELLDRRTEEIIVRRPRGHPDAPLSEAELLEKIGWLLQDRAPALKPRRLLELCDGLSNVDDVEEFIAQWSSAKVD
jgi:2-methylcitrate dehydratase